MAIFQDDAVITGNCLVLWDGITRPETRTDGKIVHSLKVATLTTAPELQEIQGICTTALNESIFKGQLPPGGCWPTKSCDPNFAEGKLQGYMEFNAKSHKGAPPVFDVNGQLLDPMQYNAMLYPGAMVQLLVHAFAFNDKSKGVALALDGIKIIDATAPRLPIGGGIDASAAFGAPSMPSQPGSMPSQPGSMPSQAGSMPSQPGSMPSQPGSMPSQPGSMPSQPGSMPSQPGSMPSQPGSMPPHPGILQPEFYNVDGSVFSKEQLVNAGYTDQQIATLPKV